MFFQRGCVDKSNNIIFINEQSANIHPDENESWFPGKSTFRPTPQNFVLGCEYIYAVLGWQRSVVVRLVFMPGLSCFGNIPWFFFAFDEITWCGSASLKLVFVMLLTLGAKALPHTHSVFMPLWIASLWGGGLRPLELFPNRRFFSADGFP